MSANTCGAVYHTGNCAGDRYVCDLMARHGGPHEDHQTAPPSTFAWAFGRLVTRRGDLAFPLSRLAEDQPNAADPLAAYQAASNELHETANPPGPVLKEAITGIPQSALGGLHGELAARLTAAEAALADFRREDEESVRDLARGQVDYRSWAFRLAADLNKITTFIREHQS